MFLMWFNYFYGVYININFYRKTVKYKPRCFDISQKRIIFDLFLIYIS
jgi:hypothetical protein